MAAARWVTDSRTASCCGETDVAAALSRLALTTNGSARTATPRTLLRLEPGGLPQAHVEDRSDLAVTTVDRTVIDCLRELPLATAVAIGDAALRAGAASSASLELGSTWVSSIRTAPAGRPQPVSS